MAWKSNVINWINNLNKGHNSFSAAWCNKFTDWLITVRLKYFNQQKCDFWLSKKTHQLLQIKKVWQLSAQYSFEIINKSLQQLLVASV